MKTFSPSSEAQLRYTYPQRILLFFLVTFVCLIVAAIGVGVITYGGMTTLSMRIGTVIQDVVLFILPAVFVAMKVAGKPASLLEVNNDFSVGVLLWSLLAMVFSIPAMNALVAWNENIVLPEALSGLEAWMQSNEESAKKSVELLFGGVSVGDLIVSLLIVAVLAAFSEEIFFRGALQRLLASGPLSSHVAIWLTAFIFSAFHMQFYGFFPRLLLGAYFGYLLWWSRSLWIPVIAHTFNNGMVVYSTWHERVSGVKADSASGGVADAVNGIQFDSPWAIIISMLLTALSLMILYRVANKNSGNFD